MLEQYRITASLGLYDDPDQHATNTWYVRGVSGGQSEALDRDHALAALDAFYQAIDGTLSAACFDGRTEYVVYRMSDPEPRIPIFVGPMATLTFGGGNPHPSDVAVCLSYNAEYASGEVRARKRGRLFFGPVTAATGTSVSNEGLRISAATLTTYTNAAQALAAALNTNSLQWRMYSPTNGDYPLLQQAWMENQYDIRRSRDKAGSTRTTVNLGQV